MLSITIDIAVQRGMFCRFEDSGFSQSATEVVGYMAKSRCLMTEVVAKTQRVVGLLGQESKFCDRKFDQNSRIAAAAVV